VFAFSSVDSFFIFSAAFRAISSSAIFVLSMSNFHGLGVSHECLFGLHFFIKLFISRLDSSPSRDKASSSFHAGWTSTNLFPIGFLDTPSICIINPESNLPRARDDCVENVFKRCCVPSP
jgi:hypothetical protein